MKYILIIQIVFLFLSCNSVKYIDRVEVKTDSTAVKERDSLISLRILDSSGYANLIEALSENRIEFKDTGSVKIIYREDGSIQEVQGQVKSLNSKLTNSKSETGYWKKAYDSLSQHKSKDSIQIKTEVKTVEVKKKVSIIPWWAWLVCGVTLVAGWKLGKIKSPA